MLTPSDQQLVVGPPMIIAALVQHCGISCCYEFQVVVSLAWLASTTHLVVIQQYLRENKVAMILNLVFLICVIAVTTVAYSIDISVPHVI